MSDDVRKELLPGYAKIEEAILTNFQGETVDITELISDVTVRESLYSMFCVFEIIVVDGVALLEKFAITGNEKIKIRISKRDSSNGEDIDTTKYLVLTGIKEYARIINQSQAYIIKAVSETAMNCSIARTSKTVEGPISKIINDLYSNEVQFNLPLTSGGEETQGNYKIILPNYTYTDIFSMLLNKAQNASGSVFFMFETLWGDMTLTSYKDMISQNPLDKYRLTDFEDDGKRKSEYDKLRTKIRDLSSNLGVSHFDAFKKGGLASRVFVNDMATKTFTQTDYDLLSSSNTKISKDFLLAQEYTVADKPLQDFNQPKTFMVNQNTLAFQGQENLQNRVSDSIAKKRFQYENQFAVSHDIKVTGDTRLRAGTMIEVELPTATDPTYAPVNRDEYLSGKYFISSVTHSFGAAGSYHETLTIRKDSIDRQTMLNKNKDLK